MDPFGGGGNDDYASYAQQKSVSASTGRPHCVKLMIMVRHSGVRGLKVETMPSETDYGGEAGVYKRLLDRDEQRRPGGRGVGYFKRTLGPHALQGVQTAFLYTFMRFMTINRGNSGLMTWMTRFRIDGRRLAESWVDPLPDLDRTLH